MTAAANFLIGSLASALATGATFLAIARFVLGLAVGGAGMVVPVYIAESSPSRVRGSLLSLQQFLITVSILLPSGINYLLALGVLMRGCAGHTHIVGYSPVKNGTGFCGPTDRRMKMRRIAMITAVVMALSAFLATAAYAGNQIIQCAGIPCIATGSSDLVKERRGNGLNDKIYLKGGSDQVRANGYTRDRDLIYGSTGYDLIYVNDGDTHDRVRGGAGGDKCYVDSRSEVVSGCGRVIVQ
jgi:hypothetical protein